MSVRISRIATCFLIILALVIMCKYYAAEGTCSHSRKDSIPNEMRVAGRTSNEDDDDKGENEGVKTPTRKGKKKKRSLEEVTLFTG